MDRVTGLKYALVLVLVTSAVLLGWTTYLERKSTRQIEAFAGAIGRAKTEAQARATIQNFLEDANQAPAAMSASADGQPCSWLCE
jgi:hypothetical protein